MGCFNTKGFFSGLDIVGREKVFVLVCVQYHPPLNLTINEEHEFDHNSGYMYPITFPIFGEPSRERVLHCRPLDLEIPPSIQ